MAVSLELVISLCASLAAGVGAYAAIRADLARLHERATHAMESANQAHHRIDGLLGRG